MSVYGPLSVTATSLLEVSKIPEQPASCIFMAINEHEGGSFLRNIRNYESTNCHIQVHHKFCSVDRKSLYNLVNKATLVHNLFLVCLFLFCTCFGRLCAHHQEKQLYLCDTWSLLFCMDNCLVCRVYPAYQTVIHTE